MTRDQDIAGLFIEEIRNPQVESKLDIMRAWQDVADAQQSGM